MTGIDAHCLYFSNAETFPETCFLGLCQILQWITSYSLCKFLCYRVRFSTYKDAHEPIIVAPFKRLTCWFQDTIKFGNEFPCCNAGTYPTTSSMDRCLIWRWHPQSKHCKLRSIGNLQFLLIITIFRSLPFFFHINLNIDVPNIHMCHPSSYDEVWTQHSYNCQTCWD